MAPTSNQIFHRCWEPHSVLSKLRLLPTKMTKLELCYLGANKVPIRLTWRILMYFILSANPMQAWSRCWRPKSQPSPKTTAGSTKMPKMQHQAKIHKFWAAVLLVAPVLAAAYPDLPFSRPSGSATKNSSRSKNRLFPSESSFSPTVTAPAPSPTRTWPSNARRT